MLKAFTFEDSGRTYNCRVEDPRGARTRWWWWFDVSEDGQRYAPFEATEDDTEADVRARVIEYYDHLLVRRAEPPAQRQHWARRTKPAVTEGTADAGAADAGAADAGAADAAAPVAAPASEETASDK